MSATSTKPVTGHANQTAPLGALAILVGAIALGAVGIALGTSYKPAPDAGVRTDAQAALHAQRQGEIGAAGVATAAEAALLAQRQGEIGAMSSAESALLIQRRGEYGATAKVFGFPSAVSGPATGSQKGLDGPKVEGPSESGGWSHSR